MLGGRLAHYTEPLRRLYLFIRPFDLKGSTERLMNEKYGALYPHIIKKYILRQKYSFKNGENKGRKNCFTGKFYFCAKAVTVTY